MLIQPIQKQKLTSISDKTPHNSIKNQSSKKPILTRV
jgi:hypothetical protein